MDPNVTPQVGDALRTTVDLVIAFGTDFFAFIVVAALVAAFAFYFGRDRLIPLVAGVYAGIPLYLNFPYMGLIGSNPWLHIGLYVAFVVVGLVGFMGLSNWVPTSGVGLIKTLGLSALTAGLILGIAINILPLHEIYVVSGPTQALFASQYFFWWLVGGLAGVLVLGK
jgi:hypothetical protein